MTPEEKAKAEVERKRREAAEQAAAANARKHTLGGALDIFKRKDTPIPEPVKRAKGGPVKYKAGGYVKAADGIAKKGKTRGKVV
jgi:hypothetical protein